MILDILKKEKNLFIHSHTFQAISIFDHIRYDRSDYDMLAPPQRTYLLKILLESGGKQVTGRKVHFTDENTTFTFPRANAMSPSPGDVLEELTYNGDSYLVLTPTQMAYALIKEFEDKFDLAMEELHGLISKQPINLDKIRDYAESNMMKSFLNTHSEDLKSYQSEVVLSDQMKNRKHLGAF